MKALSLRWRHCVAIAACLLTPTDRVLPQSAQVATPFGALDGHWKGPVSDLRIDYQRMQANGDPKRPFQWEPLRIRNRTGSMFIFSVGSRQFIGIVAGGRMRLTGDGIKETEILVKQSR